MISFISKYSCEKKLVCLQVRYRYSATDYSGLICLIKLLFQLTINNYCKMPLNYKYPNISAASRGTRKLETNRQDF